ncbi:MAG: DUF4142 domain-containing protein, partial [Pseudomonadota bacterium]|nr:DUF4142 domain-containing protein [Pseudomonadota bacterium]
SRLALQKTQNSAIKDFAQEMVNDHTKAGNELKEVLSASDAKLPQPSAGLDAAHQKQIDQLNSLSGTDFDRQYVAMQVTAHDNAVALFDDYAKSGDNSALKAFASKTLPTLQEHKAHVHRLQSEL